VNTTPLGTSPKIDETVLEKRFVTNQIIIDLIYNPQKTKLMTYSKQSYNGLYMLIIQALKSEEIWFNRKIDISLSLLNELKEVIYS
jgi:shikimate dehydrogenase